MGPTGILRTTRRAEFRTRTVTLAGSVSEESLSPQAREDLVRLFRDWKGKK